MRHPAARTLFAASSSHSLSRAGVIVATLAGALCLTQRTAAADRASPQAEAEALASTLVKSDGRPSLNQPSRCADHLKALTEANAPASITFTQAEDIPGLQAGKHAWMDAREACAVIVRADRVITFAREANYARSETTRNDGVTGNTALVKGCLNAYDAAIKAGVPPTERIQDWDFDGTMQEIRDEYCAAGLAKLNAAKEAAEAPYRKVLKNDKLARWLELTSYIDLPGGVELTPARLAAAKSWFQDRAEAKYCANGLQVHTLRRYTFNAQHKQVGYTVRDYCGRPPASAWR